MQIIYQGADITTEVKVRACVHDMYAGDHTDTLMLSFDDTDRVWDSWAPAVGDRLEVTSGDARTGVMWVQGLSAENGRYTLRAYSVPPSAFVPRTKAWAEVRLLGIGQEIAERHGLAFASYGVTDRLYRYLLQDGISDIAFYNRLARCEGCAVVVFDGTLVLYDVAERKASETAETVRLGDGVRYTYNDRSAELFTGCTIECGRYRGRYSTADGGRELPAPEWIQAGSNEECARFAKNLLAYANRGARGGCVWTDQLSGYAAASMINLQTPGAPSWDGSAFLNSVRNDYRAEKSKLFFWR